MSTAQPPAHPAVTRRGAGVAADGEFHMPTHVLFGRGVAGQAAQHAAAVGAKRIMLVSDPGVADAGLLHPVRNDLASTGLRPVIFTSVEPNPRDVDCLAGTELARDAAQEENEPLRHAQLPADCASRP
jgi:alcohol dehydrogenase YqhD (iron-dependent ADH family)